MTENKSLKPLAGTEKQVAWATEIRAKLVPEIVAVATAVDLALRERGNTVLAEIVTAAADQALSQTGAAWWIDRKPKTDLRLCAEARIIDFFAGLPEGQRDEATDAVCDLS